MPALPNRRQELFCLKVAQGIPPYRAYPEAGYKPDQSHPYRLMAENGRVRQRLIELTGTDEVEALANKDRLILELSTMAFAALGDENVKPSEKRQSIMDIAKLQGLLIDRKEVGQAGEFAKLNEHELDDLLDVTYREIALLEGEGGGDSDEEAFSSEEEEG